MYLKMIQIKAVSKTYGSKRVLYPTTLNLAKGQTHVFWGSSGSGKTTLLRLICGLTEASSGEVQIENQKVTVHNQRQWAAQIGYVIQEGGLFPHLTARQNISLAALPHNWSHERLTKRINELCDLVQLEQPNLDQFPKKLSGGQRQRVALMRSLLLDPAILLLDEPLGALDPLVRSDLQKQLKVIFNRLKKTVIIVTHDIGEGAFFGHTLSLFHEGQLVQHGDFQSFLDKPTNDFVTRFITAQAPPKELIEAFK